MLSTSSSSSLRLIIGARVSKRMGTHCGTLRRFENRQRAEEIGVRGTRNRGMTSSSKGSNGNTATTATAAASMTTAEAAAIENLRARLRQQRAHEFYKPQKSSSGFWSYFRRSPPKKPKAAVDGLSVSDRNVQMVWYSMAVVVGVLGATYASVPLYKVFCQATGFGGTTQRVYLDWEKEADLQWWEIMFLDVLRGVRTVVGSLTSAIGGADGDEKPGSGVRTHIWTDEDALAKLSSLKPVANANLITVHFDTTVGDVLPWSFEPIARNVKVVPGETALSFFRVTNHSDKAITGVATYNVHPPKAGLYFQKIQCFCFEEQRLLPGESVDMPVFYFIDPEYLDDPQVSYVTNVTLSYTFFPTDEDTEFDDGLGDDGDDDVDDDEELMALAKAHNNTPSS